MSAPILSVSANFVTFDMDDNMPNRFAAVKALLHGLPRAEVRQFLIELYEAGETPAEPIPAPEATDSDFGAFEQAGGRAQP